MNAEITEFVTRTGRKPDGWAPNWESAFNIAPTEDIPILLDSANTGELRFERARWSLVPAWSPTSNLKFSTFNARAEGMAEKNTWKKPLQSHRTIVLARGFYEWTGEKGHSSPHLTPPDPWSCLLGGGRFRRVGLVPLGRRKEQSAMGNPGTRLSAYNDMRSQHQSILAAAKHGPLQSLTDRELNLREQPLTLYPHSIQRRVRVWVRFGPESLRVDAKIVRSTPTAAGIEFRAGEQTFRCWVWGSAVQLADEDPT